MEPLGLTYNAKANRNYLFLAIAVSLFCVGLALRSPILLVLMAGAVFAGLFFANRALRWVVIPTILVFNQYLLQMADWPLQVAGLVIQPTDWIVLLLFVTLLLKQMLSGGRVWIRTGLDFPVWIFLGATGLSLFGALDLRAGLINWGHHLLYFAAFYAMVADWKSVPVQSIWRVYFFWGGLAAASAIWEFFASGGGRSLGFARLVLPAVVVPVLCFELAYLSLSKKFAGWLIVAAFAVTAVVSQTRGLWLSTGILFIVWLLSAFLFRPLRSASARKTVYKFLKLLVLLLLIFLLLTPFLGQAERRAEQLVQQSGSVYLRLFLWGVALRLFLEHPVTGVGMGQFAEMVGRYPEMKNLAVFEWTRGLSAHNLPLTFLAETGLVGTLAFVWLLVSIVRFSLRGIQKARTPQELGTAWGFFLVFFVFALSYLFAGVWDYYFVFPLALLAIFVRQLETPAERPHGH